MTSSRSDVKVLYSVTVSGFSYAGDSRVPFLFLRCGPLGWKPPDPTTVPSGQGPGDKAVTCRLRGPAVPPPQALPHPAPGLRSGARAWGSAAWDIPVLGSSCPGTRHGHREGHLPPGHCGDKCHRRPLLAQALPVPPLPHCVSGAGDQEPRCILSRHLATGRTGWQKKVPEGCFCSRPSPRACRTGLAGVCSRSLSNTHGRPEVTVPLGCRVRFRSTP